MDALDAGQTVSATIAGWEQRFQDLGAVVFRRKLSKAIVAFGVVIAAAVLGLFIGYRSSDGDQSTALVVSAVVIAILLLLLAWPIVRNRNTTISVTTDGVRLANNALVPWSEVVEAGVWSYRGNETVMLKVTGTFIREYQSRLSRAARILTTMNASLGGGDVLYLPGMLDADPDELSAWISMLADRYRAKVSSFGTTVGEAPVRRS